MTQKSKTKNTVNLEVESNIRTMPEHYKMDELNSVAEAQKQMSSQETVGVPPRQ